MISLISIPYVVFKLLHIIGLFDQLVDYIVHAATCMYVCHKQGFPRHLVAISTNSLLMLKQVVYTYNYIMGYLVQ